MGKSNNLSKDTVEAYVQAGYEHINVETKEEKRGRGNNRNGNFLFSVTGMVYRRTYGRATKEWLLKAQELPNF